MTSQLWYCAVLTPEQAASGHVEAIRRRFEEAVCRAARLPEDVADRAPDRALAALLAGRNADWGLLPRSSH